MKNENIIFFDGHCNLCNSSVNFIIDRDSRALFKFASLQSELARERLSGFPSEARPDSIALLQDGKLYWRSSAVLRIAKRMPGLWPLFTVFLIVPPFLRDGIYEWVAKNRYRWFGRQESCRMPEPGLKTRFL